MVTNDEPEGKTGSILGRNLGDILLLGITLFYHFDNRLIDGNLIFIGLRHLNFASWVWN